MTGTYPRGTRDADAPDCGAQTLAEEKATTGTRVVKYCEGCKCKLDPVSFGVCDDCINDARMGA